MRYERERPGELLHVNTPLRRNGCPVTGYGYVHSAIDNRSRQAYSEVLPDGQAPTAAAFWRRAAAKRAQRARGRAARLQAGEALSENDLVKIGMETARLAWLQDNTDRLAPSSRGQGLVIQRS